MLSHASYGAPATRYQAGPDGTPAEPGADNAAAASHTATIGRHHSAAP